MESTSTLMLIFIYRLFDCQKYKNIEIKCSGNTHIVADKDDFVHKNTFNLERFAALAGGDLRSIALLLSSRRTMEWRREMTSLPSPFHRMVHGRRKEP